jgi:hypothetical protein
MIRANHLRWIAQAWPFPQKRMHLLGEYAALGRLPLLCADIALRGGIGSPAHKPGQDVTTSIWNDGRRALAEEILALAGCDPRSVDDLIERKPRPARPGED